MYLGELREFQLDGAKFFTSKRKAICAFEVGLGKCFGKNTEILMYDGTIKYVQDIIPGDLLMGWEATPREVTELDHGINKLYEIVPETGESFTVTENHKLVLKWLDSSISGFVIVTVEDFLRFTKEVRDKLSLVRKLPGGEERVKFKVKYSSIDEYYGFEVSGPDRMFLLGDHTVVHNTHVSMASIEKLRDFDLCSLALIVCPNYLKWKWAFELEEWTDTPFVVIDGKPNHRVVLYDTMENNVNVIINYELLLRDVEMLKLFQWDVIVVDEITRIKGYRSKTRKALKRLPAKYKLGLTGTPVGNRPDELYSIMDWIDPKLFGKWWGFEEKYIVRGHFGEVKSYTNLQHLSKVSRRRMLTKTQEEVAEQLPEIQEVNLVIDPTRKQSQLYYQIAVSLEDHLDRYVSAAIDGLEKVEDFETAMIRQRFSALRQVCVAPAILKESQGKYVEQLELRYLDEIGGKIPALFDIIDDVILDTTNKLVVFSFYRGAIPIIEAGLKKRKIRYRIVMGGMDGEEIIARAKDFQNDPGIQIFLTTDAGEKGIDLQAANFLVNLDIPFSWEKYEQRLGRIKRIGSEHESCTVYNFIIRGSFEERQVGILKQKRLLANTIQGKEKDVDTIIPVEMTLREFLKITLY